jgi:D-inositol-3-phosphate glycosyltransferase
MQRLAVLSMHTSPLAQPGSGDGGGMNVYVKELSSSLARAGVSCDVYTRAYSATLPPTIEVEPGFRVHNIVAGPVSAVPKRQLHGLVEEFTEGVAARMELLAELEGPVDAIHANYWLSGVAGHTLKHRLDLPLVSTFHTLDRVKAEASPEDLDQAEPERRALAEASIIACSDAVLASCQVEVDQLVEL